MDILSRYRTAIAVLVLALGACGGGGYSPEVEPVTFGTRQWGVAGWNTVGTSAATDADGNVYVASYTHRLASYQGPTVYLEADLTKYDAKGTKLYSRRLGGVQRVWAIAIDANGYVYIAGDSDAGDTRPRLDAFLMKVDADGNELYTRQLGGPGGSTVGSSIAIDAVGNVYLAGMTEVGLDGNTLTNYWDAYFTKFSSDGIKLYTKLAHLDFEAAGESIAVDANGNVYLAGHTSTLDTTLGYGSIPVVFLAKYDLNTVQLFVRLLELPDQASSNIAAAVDAGGNVYLSANTWHDTILVKCEANGTPLYTTRLGADSIATFVYSTAIDASGNVYVAGTTEGKELDGNTLTGYGDAFLVKYDGNLNKIYTKLLGAAGARTSAQSVALDANGNVYLSGWTSGGLDGNTLTGLKYDAFLATFGAGGNRR